MSTKDRAGREGTPANAVLFTVGFATPGDVPDLMRMIRALADYERLAHLDALRSAVD